MLLGISRTRQHTNNECWKHMCGYINGLIWLLVGASGVLLWPRSWAVGLHKVRGICLLAAQLQASQDRPYTSSGCCSICVTVHSVHLAKSYTESVHCWQPKMAAIWESHHQWSTFAGTGNTHCQSLIWSQNVTIYCRISTWNGKAKTTNHIPLLIVIDFFF
jgi:hypothetical protein